MTMRECPFCGGHNIKFVAEDESGYEQCRVCGACGPLEHKRAAVPLYTWDTRAHPAGADAWQPIDTAPRDGTEILCWSPGFAMGLMVLSFYDGYWREKANGMGLKTPPTDWQPIPAPPRTQAQKPAEETRSETE